MKGTSEEYISRWRAISRSVKRSNARSSRFSFEPK
jgi:hypothetical protein